MMTEELVITCICFVSLWLTFSVVYTVTGTTAQTIATKAECTLHNSQSC